VCLRAGKQTTHKKPKVGAVVMINFIMGYILGGAFTFFFLYFGFRMYEYRNDDE
jgi:hypothetical protein